MSVDSFDLSTSSVIAELSFLMPIAWEADGEAMGLLRCIRSALSRPGWSGKYSPPSLMIYLEIEI